jgi:hypothetical protein
MQLNNFTGPDITLGGWIKKAKEDNFMEITEPSVATIDELIQLIPQYQKELKAISVSDKLEAIGYVAQTLVENEEIKSNVRKCLNKSTPYGPEMVDMEIKALPMIMDPDELGKNIDIALNTRFSLNYTSDIDEVVKREPLGTSFIISAGNATIAAFTPLLTSLLTNNFTILKPSIANVGGLIEIMKIFTRKDSCLLPNIAHALRTIANATVILYMEHDSKAYNYLLSRSPIDVINFWGGEPARSAIQEKISGNPNNPKFIVNGPLTGVAVIESDFAYKNPCVAQGLALNIDLYEGKACNSPTECLYIGTFEQAIEFGAQVAEELKRLDSKLKPIKVADGLSSQTHKMRSELRKRGARVFGSEDAGQWTLAISEEPTVQQIHEDGLNFDMYSRPRFIEIITCPTLDVVTTRIKELKNTACYSGLIDGVQTVGHAMNPELIDKLANILLGYVYRIVPVQEMFLRTAYEPSDGLYLVRELTRPGPYIRKTPALETFIAEFL